MFRYLKNIVRIITETGLRVYKELMPRSKDQVDLRNTVVRIPDSKTPNGVAVVPLTPLAVEAFEDQIASCELGPFLFPSDLNSIGHQTTLRTVWRLTLRPALNLCHATECRGVADAARSSVGEGLRT